MRFQGTVLIQFATIIGFRLITLPDRLVITITVNCRRHSSNYGLVKNITVRMSFMYHKAFALAVI